MRAFPLIAVLLLAVPLAAAEPTVLATGGFLVDGATTVVVPFDVPEEHASLAAVVGAWHAAPHPAYAVAVQLLRDGVPVGKPCALPGVEGSQSACVIAVAGEDADDLAGAWSLRIDAAGSARVGYRVEAGE